MDIYRLTDVVARDTGRTIAVSDIPEAHDRHKGWRYMGTAKTGRRLYLCNVGTCDVVVTLDTGERLP